jgi:hypothetical protein
MDRRKAGRPRKTVDEKRKRKTETQRHRREGERMAREQADAIYSSTMWNRILATRRATGIPPESALGLGNADRWSASNSLPVYI